MTLALLPLSFFIMTAATAFTVGRWWPQTKKKSADVLSSRYFDGLNFLLNEQPDKAVDVFIEMIEVDSDTVETHLALGSLFRRRGEVDRAIRIHQNLIARPALSHKQRVEALFELGQDYMRAGVLDRAESLFQELVRIGARVEPSLVQLIDIYQQQHDWSHAIETAQKLSHVQEKDCSPIIAHYYCELAEENRREGSLEKTGRAIKRALQSDPSSVRAHLLQAEMAIKLERIKQAVSIYHYIADYHPCYTPEILQPLSQCYELLQQPDHFFRFLQRHSADTANISVVSAVLHRLWHVKNRDTIALLLQKQLKQKPTVYGLKAFVDLQCSQTCASEYDQWQFMKKIVDQIIEQKPKYQCGNCGFSSKILYWFCPSCKHWDAIKPVAAFDMLAQHSLS